MPQVLDLVAPQEKLTLQKLARSQGDLPTLLYPSDIAGSPWSKDRRVRKKTADSAIFGDILSLMRRLLIFNFLILLAAFSAMAQESKQECPKIEVTGPAGVTQRGDEMTFTANVVLADLDIRYDWTVSTGTIVKGQGTASIVVIAHESGVIIKATVDVSGLPDSCESTASESGVVAPTAGCGAPLDEWGPSLRPNDVRGRLDAFFAELLNNPESKGILIFDGVPAKQRAINHPKIKFVVAHARFRKFDIERLIFAFAKEEASSWEDEYLIRTALYRIPPGADLPISDTEIFDGSLLKPKKVSPKVRK